VGLLEGPPDWASELGHYLYDPPKGSSLSHTPAIDSVSQLLAGGKKVHLTAQKTNEFSSFNAPFQRASVPAQYAIPY